MEHRKLIVIALVLGFAAWGCSPPGPASSVNMGPVEARDWLKLNPAAQLIDVRTPEEYAQDHLTGAKLIPVQELEGRTGEIDREKPVLLYCRSGKRSQKAADILKARGFKTVRQIEGGIIAWKEKGLPVEPPPKR